MPKKRVSKKEHKKATNKVFKLSEIKKYVGSKKTSKIR